MALCAGLNVHLHHNYSVHLHAPRTQYEYDLQIPLRKMVDCRTRDLHQSLLVKLNRALVRQGKSGSNGLEGARSLRAFAHHPVLEGPGWLPSEHLFGYCVEFSISSLKVSSMWTLSIIVCLSTTLFVVTPFHVYLRLHYLCFAALCHVHADSVARCGHVLDPQCMC